MRIRARLTQQHFPTQEREKEPLKDHSERELFPLRVVSLGDSLTAGTQDATTVGERQSMSYVAQLARAVGFPFHPALISEGGIGPRLFHEDIFNYGKAGQRSHHIQKAEAPLKKQLDAGIIPEDLTPIWNIPGLGRRTEESQDRIFKPQTNFAVPGYEARHLAGVRHLEEYLIGMRDGTDASGLSGEVPLIRAVLQNGGEKSRGSALDQAVARRPELALVWAGGNDALETVGAGRIDDRLLTPIADRPWTYQVENSSGVMETRTTPYPVQGFRTTYLGPTGIVPRLLRETDAEVMVMNIPDISDIATLRPLGEKLGDLPFKVTLPDGTDVTQALENWPLPNAVDGDGKGGRRQFPEGSRVGMNVILNRFIQRGEVQSQAALEEVLKELSASGFSENEVMDNEELRTVSNRIQEFNEIIAESAALDSRVHLVDMREEFKTISQGRELVGEGPSKVLGSHFTGALDKNGVEGIFSYDGVHPSDTGHAVLANVVKEKIGEELGWHPRFRSFRESPPIDEKRVLGEDPHHTRSDSV